MLEYGLFLKDVPHLLAHVVLEHGAGQHVEGRVELEIEGVLDEGCASAVLDLPQGLQFPEGVLLAERVYAGAEGRSAVAGPHSDVGGVAQLLELVVGDRELGVVLGGRHLPDDPGGVDEGDEFGVVLGLRDHRVHDGLGGLDHSQLPVADRPLHCLRYCPMHDNYKSPIYSIMVKGVRRDMPE